MPDQPTRRALLKQESRQRFLDAAAAKLRKDGLEGAPIVPVMKMAGLTHGTFYTHFENKDDLAVGAFRHAIAINRKQWIGPIKNRSWKSRVAQLARGYLNRRQRDKRADSCPYSALATDAARASGDFRRAFEQELRRSLNAMGATPLDEEEEHEHYDETIALMALFVGGLSLARAVESPAFSDRILKVCRTVAEQLGAEENT